MTQTVIPDPGYVAGAVKAAMDARGMKIAPLARELKMQYMQLYRRVNGEVSFRIEELAVVAEALDVPVEQLLGRAA